MASQQCKQRPFFFIHKASWQCKQKSLFFLPTGMASQQCKQKPFFPSFTWHDGSVNKNFFSCFTWHHGGVSKSLFSLPSHSIIAMYSKNPFFFLLCDFHDFTLSFSSSFKNLGLQDSYVKGER